MLLRFSRDSLLKPLSKSIVQAPSKSQKCYSGIAVTGANYGILDALGHNMPIIFDSIAHHPYIAISLGISVPFYYVSKDVIAKILNSFGVYISAYIDIKAFQYMKKNGAINSFCDYLVYRKITKEKSVQEEDSDRCVLLNQFVISSLKLELFNYNIKLIFL